MPYQLVTCPACGRNEQAMIKRNQPGLFVGLHTRRDGTAVLCEGTGQKVEDRS